MNARKRQIFTVHGERNISDFKQTQLTVQNEGKLFMKKGVMFNDKSHYTLYVYSAADFV